jgi:hypothetical protein
MTRKWGKQTSPSPRSNFNIRVILDSVIFPKKTPSTWRHDHHDVEVTSKYSDIPVGGGARISRAKRQVRHTPVLKYSNTRKNFVMVAGAYDHATQTAKVAFPEQKCFISLKRRESTLNAKKFPACRFGHLPFDLLVKSQNLLFRETYNERR